MLRLRLMLTKWLLGYLRVAGLFALVVGACEDWGPRVYTAQFYQPDADCLGAYAPLGLVEADDLGASCEPTCLRLADDLYVSTVCPPYPSEASVEDPATSSDCSVALGLLDAETFCDAAPVDDAAAVDAGAADGSTE
jgi:hypothetical protein